jgi:hypothetical protein
MNFAVSGRFSRRRALAEGLRSALASMIASLGARPVAAQVGVHPQTACALAAGARGNASTVAAVEHALAAAAAYPLANVLDVAALVASVVAAADQARDPRADVRTTADHTSRTDVEVVR